MATAAPAPPAPEPAAAAAPASGEGKLGKRHKGEDALDALLDAAPSPAAGQGGLGLGTLGTIGHGGGTGSGYGRGAGGLGGRSASGYGLAGSHLGSIFGREPGQEAYAHQPENEFHAVREQPLSTFSVDVDTASYSNVRRFLQQGQLPPPEAVRTEELINYFPYDDAPPTDGQPFAAHVELAACPWAPGHQLLRIGIKAREIDAAQRPPSNLTFLIDVSGSMQPDNRLPLLKRALALLVRRLDARDRVAIVVYAGSSGVVLPPTRGDRQREILAALERLEAGGSTNGAAGIGLAYQLANENFIEKGSNRVILATDGDFNVGATSPGALLHLIEREVKRGVFLSVLGFGMGNLKDATMEKLADKGNGHYAYIDTLQEARKVLVEQMTGTLITVAKDVKLQLALDAAHVRAYRQVGYENRQLRTEDFANDKIDAGDIGAGHGVTALYELVPEGTTDRGAWATVKIRYKPPTGDQSQLLSFPVAASPRPLAQASTDFQLSAAAAQLGMLLSHSRHKGRASWESTLALARAGRGEDPHAYRGELIQLAELAQRLEQTISRR